MPPRATQHGPCPTCGLIFISATSKIYCSLKCYVKSDQFQQQRLRVQAEFIEAGRKRQQARKAERNARDRRTCLQCGEEFIRRSGRENVNQKFCSIKCYTQSPALIKRLQDHNVSISKPVKYTCLECGKEWFAKASRQMRFCSRAHYRAFLAKRFDRWIANPETIALPQNYDEFLLKEELPCLVGGCNWTGSNLGFHVNMSHGILAREFKQMAGFNLGTGLVTPEVSASLSARPHLREVKPWFPLPLDVEVGRTPYKSLEGHEHAVKGRALSSMTFVETLRTCRQCGRQFKQTTPFGLTRYCSTRCRSKFYTENNGGSAVCTYCNVAFTAKAVQFRRFRHGKPVACSNICKGKLNSSKIKRVIRARARELNPQ